MQKFKDKCSNSLSAGYKSDNCGDSVTLRRQSSRAEDSRQDFFGSSFNLEQDYIKKLSPTCLAYVGDSVYELYTRVFFAGCGKMKLKNMHNAVVSFVSCRGQTKAYELICSLLSEDEADLFRRGRNTKSSVPRNADVYEYRCATGLECLLGYLFLSRNYLRLNQIMQLILSSSKNVE